MTKLEQWIEAARAVETIEPWLIPVIQGLGRLDAHLIEAADHFAGQTPAERQTLHESLRLTDRVTLAYLWVLGTYEVVRTLDQRIRAEPVKLAWCKAADFNGVKKQLTRLRIPLAKFEAAKAHKATDRSIAYPALRDPTGVVAWNVGRDTFIERKDLSDIVLKALLILAAQQSSGDDGDNAKP